MKKALITLLISLVMSAGIIFSADMNSLSASTIPLSYEVSKDLDRGELIISNENLIKGIIEYTFYSNDILMSKLETIDLSHESCEIGTDRNIYSFKLPDNALSFKVWRVVEASQQIKSLEGDFEYIHSEETSIDSVETRVKVLYITDDLITKEPSYSETAEVWIFKMHFNVDDAEGVTVPIDRIYSVEVEYNVVKKFFFGAWTTTTPVNKVIKATETRNAMIWPYLIPETVINNIQESIDDSYDWMINLGSASVPRLTGSDVTIDQTSILKISYFYNGVFYEDLEVIDEPYDGEDVVPVVPGTTDPLLGLGEWFAELGSKIQLIIMGIVIIIALVFISLIFKGITAVKTVIVMLYKLIAFFMKAMSFIMLGIPKWIINAIIFLIIPRTKRKEQSNANRYL